MDQKILVGTTDGLYEVIGDRHDRVIGHEVTSMASGDSGWWAIIDGREVWHAQDTGAWLQVASADTRRANCILPTAAGTFVGMSQAQLFVLRGEALEPVLSFDEVKGREKWYTPWGGPPDVRSMSGGPGTAYVNVHVGGVVRSTDGGERWEPTIDIDADVHQVLFDRGSGLILAASARGLAISEDGGTSWRFQADGLHGRYLRAVAVAGTTVLVTASTGPSTSRGAVYRKSLVGAEPFERCQTGLQGWFPYNIDTYCLDASDLLATFGTPDGSVYLSSDQGLTWALAADGLAPIRCVALG